MPRKEIPDELIDQLLAGREGPEALTGPDGLLKQLTKRVVERAASAELTEHLGYELAGEPPEGQPNRRNGWSAKTVLRYAIRAADGVNVNLRLVTPVPRRARLRRKANAPLSTSGPSSS